MRDKIYHAYLDTKTIREKKNYELSDTGQLFRLVREIFNINIIRR